MRALKSRYRVILLTMSSPACSNGKPLEKAVVITFDDGYRNNALQAAPVLKELGLPYTVYVSTSYVESGYLDPAQSRSTGCGRKVNSARNR